MDFKCKVVIEGETVILDWKELNETILFGNDLSSNQIYLTTGVLDINKVEIFDRDEVKVLNKQTEQYETGTVKYIGSSDDEIFGRYVVEFKNGKRMSLSDDLFYDMKNIEVLP